MYFKSTTAKEIIKRCLSNFTAIIVTDDGVAPLAI